MIRPRLTRFDADVLNLREEGLHVETIASILACEASRVTVALRKHADRRAAGIWSDAA